MMPLSNKQYGKFWQFEWVKEVLPAYKRAYLDQSNQDSFYAILSAFCRKSVFIVVFEIFKKREMQL